MRHNYKKIGSWKKGMDLVVFSYEITSQFPDSEKFGLISQMNRCAVSIPSNIAEGSSKTSNKHFKNFLEIALGSAFEWETQLTIAYKLNFIPNKKFQEFETKIIELQKMIIGFINSLDLES